MKVAKADRRIQDEDGNIVETYAEKPMLNTLMYDMEFPDGATKPYAANMIAENLHNYVDSDGHQYRHFGEILNYCKTANATAIADATAARQNGWGYQRKTTDVWNLLIGMKYLLEQWHPLKDMKY